MSRRILTLFCAPVSLAFIAIAGACSSVEEQPPESQLFATDPFGLESGLAIIKVKETSPLPCFQRRKRKPPHPQSRSISLTSKMVGAIQKWRLLLQMPQARARFHKQRISP